jgi:predicted Zn-ribbon and HTH transcriptional regulator
MLTVKEAEEIEGVIQSKYEEQIVCRNCGYDLDESEIAADTCADCGATLSLAKHVKIYATTLPGSKGDTLV